LLSPASLSPPRHLRLLILLPLLLLRRLLPRRKWLRRKPLKKPLPSLLLKPLLLLLLLPSNFTFQRNTKKAASFGMRPFFSV